MTDHKAAPLSDASVSVQQMPGRIERIVVFLDAAAENRTAIDTAARLAARTRATLHGIFVEDEDLLHLALLPFVRQVTMGAGAEPLTTQDVENQLRAAATRARQELWAAADRHGLRVSFKIVRGATHSAFSFATEHDFIVAGGLTKPIGGHFRVGCRWLASIDAAPGPFLLARHAWNSSGSVVTLLRDRSPQSVKLLHTAAQIAGARGGRLSVICLPSMPVGADVASWITNMLATFSLRLGVEAAPPEITALHRLLVELDCQLLAIAASTSEGAADRLREFAERFGCDILFAH